jgi:hypothetical protein
MNAASDRLLEYYSSQATVMLAQYRTVELLLGHTTHHTHTGTLCEALLRDVLRKNLLPWMNVDKGFVYGRIDHKEPKGHGPEIDILIHDGQRYRPLFRLDDFVIVQPESVIGMIQVKKTLATSGENPLQKAIKNIALANQHLLDLRVLQNKTKERKERPGMDCALEDRVFSGVVAYDDTLQVATYRTWLSQQYKDCQSWSYPDAAFDTGAYNLPTFIGSLTGTCFVSPWQSPIDRRTYHVYDAECGDKNISLQLLLWNLSQFAFNWRNASPPFSFAGVKPRAGQEIVIPTLDEAWFKKSG